MIGSETECPEIERIDRIAAPPVLGRIYLVPTVRAARINRHGEVEEPREWPVVGPLHEDMDLLAFPSLHYHIDFRFTPDMEGGAVLPIGGKSPRYRPMRYLHRPAFVDLHPCEFGRRLRSRFLGHMCRKGPRGWVCPHKQVPLGSVEPVEGGIIYCPLHGLAIDAASGMVV